MALRLSTAQGDHLINVIEVQFPDALQAGLHDLLEGLLPLAGPVDALIVVDLSGPASSARVFLMMDKVTSGFRAMRIPRASVKVIIRSLTRKSLLRTYKSYSSNLLILNAVAVPLIQPPQPVHDLFPAAQDRPIQLHGMLPFLPLFSILSLYFDKVKGKFAFPIFLFIKFLFSPFLSLCADCSRSAAFSYGEGTRRPASSENLTGFYLFFDASPLTNAGASAIL